MRLIEAQPGGTRCSILLLDSAAGVVRHGAAPGRRSQLGRRLDGGLLDLHLVRHLNHRRDQAWAHRTGLTRPNHDAGMNGPATLAHHRDGNPSQAKLPRRTRELRAPCRAGLPAPSGFIESEFVCLFIRRLAASLGVDARFRIIPDFVA